MLDICDYTWRDTRWVNCKPNIMSVHIQLHMRPIKHQHVTIGVCQQFRDSLKVSCVTM